MKNSQILKRFTNVLSFLGLVHLAWIFVMVLQVAILYLFFGLIYPDSKYEFIYSHFNDNRTHSWDSSYDEVRGARVITEKDMWLINLTSNCVECEPGDYFIDGAIVFKEHKNYIETRKFFEKYGGKRQIDFVNNHYPIKFQLIFIFLIYLTNYILIGRPQIFPKRHI